MGSYKIYEKTIWNFFSWRMVVMGSHILPVIGILFKFITKLPWLIRWKTIATWTFLVITTKWNVNVWLSLIFDIYFGINSMSVCKYISHNWRSNVYGVTKSTIKCGWHRNAVSLPWYILKILQIVIQICFNFYLQL
jgi:hypothetical protein